MPYKRPPITEAIIELRFKRPFDHSTVEKAVRRVREEYVFEDPENGVNFTVDTGAMTTSFETAWTGAKLSTLDRADILILRTNAFVCSRLAPYGGWETFRPRAAHAWDVWKRAAGPTELARIGVRYINRIDVPMAGADLIDVDDYLRLSPRSPEALGEPMTAYTMQIVRPLGIDECHLILTSGSVPSPLVGYASFALDLDIFRETKLPMRDDELWTLIDKIREHKNRVFESCITDRARTLFNQ
jgi:uncharacterized protein (TIGR04255 family)